MHFNLEPIALITKIIVNDNPQKCSNNSYQLVPAIRRNNFDRKLENNLKIVVKFLCEKYVGRRLHCHI